MNHLQISLLILLYLGACQTKQEVDDRHPQGSLLDIRYAEGFSITKEKSYTILEVSKPFQGASKGYKYYLVPKGEKVPDNIGDSRLIRTPVSSIVCTSTTHIPLLDYLDLTDRLVGFPTTDYISSEKARKLIDIGKVKDLGVDKSLNLEELVVLGPQMLMGYTMTADYGQFKKIEEFGIPVILNAEYLERHPLGRAEWIKFVAAFFDKEKLADSVFSAIEKNYIETSELTTSVKEKPKIMSGIMYGDAWFLPGGQNYASKILKDAGCNYLWAEDPSHGYLELSFETIFEKANNADIWIGVGPYSSLSELTAGDHRYNKFSPLVKGQVYSYDARKGARGGNEYLELGYLRPDLILKDLVKIAHPELVPEHELFFHRKLQ